MTINPSAAIKRKDAKGTELIWQDALLFWS